MIKKIFNYIKNDIKQNYRLYLVFLVTLLLLVVKLDYYIYSPGSLIDLSNRIEVEKSYESKGSFNLTYVTARSGNVINILLSYVIPSWDMVSVDNMRYESENEIEIEKRDKIYLKETSYDAIIAAFNEANIKYNIDSIDLTITYVFNDAKTDLKQGDIIKKVNGISITSFEDLNSVIGKYKEKDKLNFEVLRDNKLREAYAYLIKADNRNIIGITLSEIKNITTNPNVKYIFKKNESGSSRGLMCALDIYNKITEYDLTKGKKISGTGSIDENGIVGEIGGVKYKLIGAVKNKADVFIVPSNNYEEALSIKNKYKYNIEIIKADNLHNVILKLKELN